MKKIPIQWIIIVLIIILFSCLASVVLYGQEKDTIVSKWTTATHAKPASGIGSTLIFTGVETITPKQDTIPVIMLVCDTSIANKSEVRDGVVIKIGGIVMWQFGYEVFNNGYLPSGIPIKSIYKYLDRYKKPLQPNIVVWMTKELNK